MGWVKSTFVKERDVIKSSEGDEVQSSRESKSSKPSTSSTRALELPPELHGEGVMEGTGVGRSTLLFDYFK